MPAADTEARARPLLDALPRAMQARDRTAINAIAAELLDIQAPLGASWRAIAQLMVRHGELTLARRAMRAFVAGTGNVAAARFEEMTLLAQCGQLEEARALAPAVSASVPHPADHAFFLGSTALNLGLIEEARTQLQAAVAARPAAGQAWLALAMSGDMANDAIADRLLAAASSVAAGRPVDQAAFRYAAGKVHADRGEHDQAFAACAEGAKLLASVLPYDRGADARSAEQAMAYADGMIARLRIRPPDRIAPAIFVTGLPRSGTTLVEQILASHSVVADGAELNLLRIVAQDVGGVSGAALAAYEKRGGSGTALGALYAHLVAERFGPGAGLVVDKTLDTSRYLGIVAAAMPDARIVWVRRDPLDCAWSCFRTFFVGGAAWSLDLRDIAYHFRLEDELLGFWQDRLGDRLSVVRYADLIDDREAATRRLLAHCGLAEEPGPFAPHETKRAVITASVQQVRRPVNRDGIGSAEPYRGHLAPFLRAYSAG